MAWKLIHKQAEDSVVLNVGGDVWTSWMDCPGLTADGRGTVLCDCIVMRSRLTGAAGAGTVTVSLYQSYGPAATPEHSWRVRGFHGSDAYAPHVANPNSVINTRLYAMNMFAHASAGCATTLPLAGDRWAIKFTSGGTIGGTVTYWTEWYQR